MNFFLAEIQVDGDWWVAISLELEHRMSELISLLISVIYKQINESIEEKVATSFKIQNCHLEF